MRKYIETQIKNIQIDLDNLAADTKVLNTLCDRVQDTESRNDLKAKIGALSYCVIHTRENVSQFKTIHDIYLKKISKKPINK